MRRRSMTRAASAPEQLSGLTTRVIPRETSNCGKEGAPSRKRASKRRRTATAEEVKEGQPEDTHVATQDTLSSSALSVAHESQPAHDETHKKRKTGHDDTPPQESVLMSGASQLRCGNSLGSLYLAMSPGSVASEAATVIAPDSEIFDMKQDEHDEIRGRREPITHGDLVDDGDVTGWEEGEEEKEVVPPSPSHDPIQEEPHRTHEQEAARLAALVAGAAARASAPPANLGECVVCGIGVGSMSSSQYASHLRTHTRTSYAHSADDLKARGIGICDGCCEARILTQSGAVRRHTCRPHAEAQTHFPRPEEWSGLPWPEGVPFPPAHTPHPHKIDYPSKVVRTIPLHYVETWGDVVMQASNALANAVELRDSAATARALTHFLGMSTTIARSKRGGKRHKSQMLARMHNHRDRSLGLDVFSIPSRVVQEEEGAESPVEESKRSDDQRRTARVQALVNEGHRGKAARVLRSTDAVQVPSDELTARLQAKFPPPRTHINRLNPVGDRAPRFMMEISVFAEALKKRMNGSSGGQSGLTSEHIKPLLVREDVMTAFYRVHRLLIDGEFPDWAHPYIFSQRLLGLGVKERPVCIGEFIARSCAALVNNTCEAQDKAFFLRKVDGRYAVQFANSIAGGAEVMFHLIGSLVHEAGAGNVCISDDGKNAYNSLDRVKAVNDTMTQFPSTRRWLHWAYGKQALLRHGNHTVECGEGALQGDPLGGRIHDTPMQPVLVEAVRRTTQVFPQQICHAIAFRDDVYVVGPPEPAIYCHKQIKLVRKAQLNVETAEDKVLAYCPQSAFLGDEAGMESARCLLATHVGSEMVKEGGMKVLGGPISEDDSFFETFLTKQAEKYPEFLPRLLKVGAKAGLQLLRSTHLPIVTFLTRIVNPNRLKPIAGEFDRQVFDHYVKLTGDSGMREDNPTFRAPFRLGGLAFRSVERTCPIAYLASLVNAVGVMGEMDTATRTVMEYFRQSPDQLSIMPALVQSALTSGMPNMLVDAWQVAHTDIFADHPSELFGSSLHDFLTRIATGDLEAGHLQALLTADAEDAWAKEAEGKGTDEDRARTNANTTRGSNSIFSFAPTSALIEMSDDAFSLAHTVRTGTHEMPELMCVCGNHTTTFDHVISCKKLQARFIRHDIIVMLVCNMFKNAGLSARTEIRVVNGTQKRMDVVVFDASKTYWIDVSIVNPLAASYIHSEDAIKGREDVKRQRWSRHAAAVGATFLPFVVNAFGGLGSSAISILQMVASKSLKTVPI